MPIAIKKELVFGILILLLLVLFILNMTKKAGNTDSKFANLLGQEGLIIIESTTRNAVDSSITYTLPSTTIINNVNASYYKWPLLYLIDVGSITTSQPTAATLNNSDAYKKPPPKALLNSASVSFGNTAAGTTGYYALTSLPAEGTFFPNLINLTNLYGSTPTNNLQAPTSNAFTVNTTDNTVAASSTGSWVLPGLSAVINAPLINGRSYILGVSAQLTAAYVNLYGTSKYVISPPIDKRFGSFTYVPVSYSLSGLTVTVPGSPSDASAVTLTLSI